MRHPNGGEGRSRTAMFAVLSVVALIALGALTWGACTAFVALESVCDAKCVVDDTDVDVVVQSSGKMVGPEVISYAFALTNGANLAHVDFVGVRDRLLKRIPNIRDMRIERRLPNRVTITVTEREPIARVAGVGKGPLNGRVVDSEGVVFRFSRDIPSLPIIREKGGTEPGERLNGIGVAALQLVEAMAEPELVSLSIQEIDTTKPDYLLLTLGNYSRAKIAWERMGEASKVSKESLRKQLRRLSKAIASNLASKSALWTATDWKDPGRVYASDPNRTN